MPHQKKNRTKKEQNKCNDEINEKESSQYDLVKKIQSLTVKIEKEHLLRDELLIRKSALECFWENEKGIIKDHVMKYHLLSEEIRSASFHHKVQVEDLTVKLKDQLQYQQNSILKSRNDSLLELRHIHKKNAQDIQARDFDAAAYQDALKDIEITHKAFLYELKRENSLKKSDLCEEFIRKNHVMTKRWEQNLHLIREESQLKTKSEIDELDVENKMKSKTKIKEHEEKSERQRIHFNEVLHSQLDEIETLKAAVNRKRQIVTRSRKKRSSLVTRNEEIKYPYENSKQDVESLTNRAVTFDKINKLLSKKENELKLKEDRLRQLKWKHEILFQQFELLDTEKNKKQKDLNEAHLSLKQRESLASTLLKKEMDTLRILSNQNGIYLIDTIYDDQ